MENSASQSKLKASAAAVARLGMLRRQNTRMLSNRRTFVVAYDGSRAAQRAARLAAFLHDETSGDQIKVVTVASSDGIANDKALALLRTVEIDLRNVCGVRPKLLLKPEVLAIKDGQSLAQTITNAADNLGGAVLVMGAAGKRLEDAAASKGKRASGQAPMGHVAEDVMQKCTSPVILVKDATPCLSTEDGMLQRREHKAHGVIMVAVDATPLSRQCFDLAQHFARPGVCERESARSRRASAFLFGWVVAAGARSLAAAEPLASAAPTAAEKKAHPSLCARAAGDSIEVVHVQDSERAGGSTPRDGVLDTKAYYTDLCAKSAVSHEGVSFEYKSLPKKGSIRDTLLTYGEESLADLVVMGSVELAKPGSSSTQLGSVSAAVAKKTQGHILICKHFA